MEDHIHVEKRSLPKSSQPTNEDTVTTAAKHHLVDVWVADPTVPVLLLHLVTRLITQEQLINEVKGIHAGSVTVEKKCLAIDQERDATTTRLTNEQWQALVTLHRTLLHKHHHLFLASQHTLRIHPETVPAFEETWVERPGDLARYRLAIDEESGRGRGRESWGKVATNLYHQAAMQPPLGGRIQHYLAVLAWVADKDLDIWHGALEYTLPQNPLLEPTTPKQLEAFVPWKSILDILNAMTTQENLARQVEDFLDGKGHCNPSIQEDYRMQGLTWSLYHFLAERRIRMWPPADVAFSQHPDAADAKDCLDDQVQSIIARPAPGDPERHKCTGQITVSRTASTLTSALRMMSRALLKFIPAYLALFSIPGAFAHQDFQTSRNSNGSDWIGALILSIVIVIGGQIAKDDLSHSFALSVWIASILAYAWPALDGSMRCVAVVDILFPLLTALYYAQNRRQTSKFAPKESIDMMEKAGIDSRDGDGDNIDGDDEDDSSVPLDWIAQPGGRDGSTESAAILAVNEVLRSQLFKDCDSGSETFGDTYGFQREDELYGSTQTVKSSVDEMMSDSKPREDRDSSPESFNGTYGFQCQDQRTS